MMARTFRRAEFSGDISRGGKQMPPAPARHRDHRKQMKINCQHAGDHERQGRNQTAGLHPARSQQKRGESQQRHGAVRTADAAVKNQQRRNGQKKSQQDGAARADEFARQQRPATTHNTPQASDGRRSIISDQPTVAPSSHA